MSSVSVDPKQVEWFLTHAVEMVYPTREALRERLLSGQKLTVYHGIDPTGPTLHLGHTVPLRKLSELQKLGHKVILLIGDFTAMIGDPTDKAATRKKLTREEVLENCKLYKQQASFLLDFDGPNAAEFRFNSEWLAKMSFADVVELASHFTVQQMMERDMFEKRQQEGKPIHLHEFFYPLMQGYDSVALEVDLEIGGNDQTFNMLAGRTLLKTLKHKEKFVLTNRLLADPTGKKMGKSEGNMIALTDEPNDAYGKVMSWTDEMIVPGFEILTNKNSAQIDEIKDLLKKENPMKWKRHLASLLVEDLFGEEAAKEAGNHFERVHSHRQLPGQDEIPVVSLGNSLKEGDILSLQELLFRICATDPKFSKSEARRLIEQGAVKVEQEVQRDPKFPVKMTENGVLIQRGSRYFYRAIL